MNFDISTFNVKKYDDILSKGLSKGLGNRESTMCIEAAICTVLDLPHSDNPQCVTNSVRAFKINLNDKNWSSNAARASGLRDLGLAQLGSLGVVNDKEFVTILSKKVIQILIPKLYRKLYPNKFVDLVNACEILGDYDSIKKLAYAAAAAAANAAANADAANAAANAAGNAGDAAYSAAYVAVDAAVDANAAAYAAAAYADEYLILVANLALETLRELKSPGISLLG